MTSRKRVLAALRHEETDRVPVDLAGMRSTGIMGMAYNALKAHLDIFGGRTRIYDIGQQLALPEHDILDRFGCDVVPISLDEPQEWKPFTLPDGSPCEVPADFNPERLDDGSLVLRNQAGEITSRMPADGYYFSGLHHGLAHVRSIAELEAIDLSSPVSQASLDALENRARHLYETTSYALMFSSLGSVFETCQGHRGWDQFLMDLAGDPDFAGLLMDKVVDAHIERARQILAVINPYVQVVVVGDDLGMQSGPQISPDLYRRLVMPRHKRLYQFIRQNTDASLFLHSCGSVYKLIPDLIEAGIQVLNPIQVAAADMDTARLKREFGRDLVFWGGGCDTQHVLPFGSPQEVDDEVEKRMTELKPGGGFIFSQVHNIQANTPPENIIALYEAAHKYGSY